MRKQTRAATVAAGAMVAMAMGWFTSAHAQSGPRLCTWGGTAANPTGTVTSDQGLTNTPSTQTDKFVATAELSGGGPCTGTMTFRGVIEPGATCIAQTFDGQVEGVPGIATFHGRGQVGLVQEFLYDQHGNLVGSDQADVLTVANVTSPDSPFFTCNTPAGTTGGTFSAAVELSPSYGRG